MPEKGKDEQDGLPATRSFMPDFDSINWTGAALESSSENEILVNNIQLLIKNFERQKELLFWEGQARQSGGRPVCDARDGLPLAGLQLLPLATPGAASYR